MRNKLKMKTIILTIGIIFAVSFISYYNIIDNQQNKDKIFKFLNSELQTAGEGEKINVMLHQSYLNTSTIELTNLSDSSFFTVPCPTEPTFNSSSIKITINDIYAPNKTLNIEVDSDDYYRLDFSSDETYAFSFELLTSCYFNNFSMIFDETDTDNEDAYIRIEIRYAENNSNNIEPSSLITTLDSNYFIGDNIPKTQFNFIGYNEYLNVSNTFNNTFFIMIKQTTSTTTTRVSFYYERDDEGDNLDSSLVYEKDGDAWILEQWDAYLVIGLSPLNNTPKPSQTRLKINNTAVSDNVNNSGYWMISNQEFTDSDGELEFYLTADYDWWDLSCNIIRVQVNYTKTDLKADSTYIIPEKDLFIWNASINEDITCYDARIDDYNSIIFKIPANWSDIRAFNGSTEKSVDASAPAINGYREVIVLDAGNGANWFLTAKVDNRTPTQPDDDGKPAEEVLLVIVIIIILSIAAGIGIATAIIVLIRKRKQASEVI